eukprot:COSAG02_NODE_52375_length_308_cov_0.741627_1_plen_39_part_01
MNDEISVNRLLGVTAVHDLIIQCFATVEFSSSAAPPALR